MLDGARDAERDIEVGSHRLAGLPDLLLIRPPARVGDRARCADRAAQRVCQVFHQMPVLGTLDASPAGDDSVRLGDVQLPGLRGLDAHDFRARGDVARIDRLDAGLGGLGRFRGEDIGARCRDLESCISAIDLGARLAGVDGPGADQPIPLEPQIHQVGDHRDAPPGARDGAPRRSGLPLMEAHDPRLTLRC